MAFTGNTFQIKGYPKQSLLLFSPFFRMFPCNHFRSTRRWASAVTLTCFYHMVHGGKALENSNADWAQDQDCWQTAIAHECPSIKPSLLICTMHISRNGTHQAIWHRHAGILAPPAVYYQCYIEAWVNPRDRKLFIHLLKLYSAFLLKLH